MSAAPSLPQSESTPPNRFRNVAPALVIVAMTLVAYVPAIRGGYIWDDPDYVTNNEHLRSAQGLAEIWVPSNTPQYYPLVFTSFWIEYQIWKLAPLGYHLTNVLLHAIGAVLVWRILRRLGVPGAWCCAAVFALHPVHVESVAWITERKNVLSGVFYLLAMGSYLRYERGRSWRWYAGALALFVAALLSKTVTCTLPAALLLLTWYRGGRIGRWDMLRMIPFFLLGAALALITVRLEREHVGAGGADWALSLGQRIVLAGRALWFYAGKLLLPLGLTFVYPRWEPASLNGVMWMAPMGCLGVLGVLWRLRNRIGRGALAGTAFFLVTLSPALGFVDVFPFRYSFVADHFQYLASLGLIVLAVAALARALTGQVPLRRAARPVIAGASLALLAGLTWNQCGTYKDEERLWNDTLARNPSAWMAHFNLGLLLEARGDNDAAFERYRITVRLRPQHNKAHTLLARDFTLRGELDRAAEHYRAALEVNPLLLTPNINLGNIHASRGEYQQAIHLYQTALGVRPHSPEANFALANTLLTIGDFAGADRHYRAALDGGPDNAAIRANLGMAVLQLGRPDDAVVEFERALALDADLIETRLMLAGALSRAGRCARAVRVLREGLERARDEGRMMNSLAWLLTTCADDSVRDGAEALSLAQKLIERTGRKDAAALRTLAAAFAEQGDIAEALTAIRMARNAAAGNQRLLQQIERMIASFERGEPFRTGDGG